MRYTLITGASGGIGYEFAKIFAREKHNLILAARDEEKLRRAKEELEKQFGISALVIAKDLSVENAPAEVFEYAASQNLQVDILVNNAGFGDLCDFLNSDLEKQKRMIRLNISALVQLTYLFGNEMKKQKRGKILNIASLAGLSAIPNFAVYAASKAFVLSFSQSVSEELKKFGVSVTALCPGPVATGFENAANAKYSKFLMSSAYSAKKIARVGYNALVKGKPVQYGGFLVWQVNVLSRILPRGIVRKFLGMML